ncbi:hypothetical protein ES703_91206 [subsurface metagenome]
MIIFIIWIALGFCLLLSGCRASLRAGYLQSDIALSAFGSTAPAPVEFADDKSRVEPE